MSDKKVYFNKPQRLTQLIDATATDDPRVLGIEPIPNIQDKISAMIQKYRAETIDIKDVTFEEVDLEFDSLFPTSNDDVNGTSSDEH